MTPHTSNTVPLFMKQNSNKDMTDKTPTMTASPTNTVAALKIMNYILINSQFANFKVFINRKFIST